MPDRKNLPADDDSAEDMLPDEHPEKSDSLKETDKDDLVHRGAAGESKPAPESDPDDAVHRMPGKPAPSKGEVDPDDMVHGG